MRDEMGRGGEAHECGVPVPMDMDGCAIVPMAAAGPNTRIYTACADKRK